MNIEFYIGAEIKKQAIEIYFILLRFNSFSRSYHFSDALMTLSVFTRVNLFIFSAEICLLMFFLCVCFMYAHYECSYSTIRFYF